MTRSYVYIIALVALVLSLGYYFTRETERKPDLLLEVIPMIIEKNFQLK